VAWIIKKDIKGNTSIVNSSQKKQISLQCRYSICKLFNIINGMCKISVFSFYWKEAV